MKGSLSFFLISLVALLLGACRGGGLGKNFYKETCPEAEDIVQKIIWKNVALNSTLPAKFLRMHFHDCFVRGCDASVLIDSTASNSAEKDSIPNQTVGGFDVIEEVKTELEKKCPGIVSCADIVALAARDSVSFQVSSKLN
ncbi:peroxidase [Citrus sinensis]|nr:peroxidase [Citrus sinensis]